MAIILLHSSKTMRSAAGLARVSSHTQKPLLDQQASELAQYLATLSKDSIAGFMKLSSAKADQTYQLVQSWRDNSSTMPAIDAFLGDIYSGLQVTTFNAEDREYANNHLYILSGLYGVLRALDDIKPYRLEMGYKLPGNAHNPSLPNITSLYSFWADRIALALPNDQLIVNLSAVEYTKGMLPHLGKVKGSKRIVITPKFLTVSPKTGSPVFVTVHAKIARGAFAHWMITKRVEKMASLKDFNELGYVYDETLSTDEQPVFVAQEFKGLGMSVRLA